MVFTKTLKIFLTIILLLAGFSVKAQVDPEWLKSWNEANELKPSDITSVSRIAPKSEAGVPFVIKGKVFNPDNSIGKGVTVHSYHRDAKGFDFGENDSQFTTWKLQGWTRTDKDGTFEFRTIRPAADHIGREGAHIHFTTISTEFGRQWANKVFLSDDPLLTKSQRKMSKEAGKYGWICEVKEKDGIQYIEVNIILKENGDF